MNSIIKIISTSIVGGRILAKFFRYGKSDVQDVPQALPHGIDSNPVEGMVGLYVKTEEKGKGVLVGYVQESVLSSGETRVYSTNSNGDEQANAIFKNNGDLELNGNTKNMVRFQDLETGFNQLRGDLNNLISVFNTHVHAGAGTPPTPVPSVIPVLPSGADISASKIDNIKTN